MKISMKSISLFSSCFFILYVIDTYIFMIRDNLNITLAYSIRIFEFLIFFAIAVLIVFNLKKKIVSDESTIHQIKDLKNTLKDSETRFQSLVSNIPGVAFRCSCIDWKMILISDEMENLSGFKAEDFLGNDCKTYESIIYPDDILLLRQTINKSIEEKENFNVEYRIIHKDGSVKWVYEKGLAIYDKEGALLYLDGVIIDITEKRKLEEMVVQSEKMLSVGGLAAGMAHEINNPLAGMMQTANVMANRLGKKLEMKSNIKAAAEMGISIESIRSYMESRNIFQMLDAINVSGKRISVIINDILGFARKDENVKSDHNMNELIDTALKLAATDFDLIKGFDFKKIIIRKKYADNLPHVYCNKARIQQVLLNIFRNCAQAMQSSNTDSPRLSITTNFESKEDSVVISIADNGPGMTEDVRKRIFEPFFTTKPEGIGTGLGLSVSYFIITEHHNGELVAESSPGSGAKFIIKLPVGH